MMEQTLQHKRKLKSDAVHADRELQQQLKEIEMVMKPPDDAVGFLTVVLMSLFGCI